MGSMGEVMDLPGEMSNRLAMVLINEGWEMWMVPSSRFLVIQMPSSQSGSPKSSISKLPLILLIISSIYAVVFDANKPSSTYQPAI